MVKSGGGAKAATAAVDKTPEKPRLDYVFIMGRTRRRATRSTRRPRKYFRIHYPQADLMVTTNARSTGVLAHIDRNIKDPIGNLYIVSHGNEDGTLSFGLDDGRHRSKTRRSRRASAATRT